MVGILQVFHRDKVSMVRKLLVMHCKLYENIQTMEIWNHGTSIRQRCGANICRIPLQYTLNNYYIGNEILDKKERGLKYKNHFNLIRNLIKK